MLPPFDTKNTPVTASVMRSEVSLKLYKYLPSKYLDTVLSEGIILFRSLSYFQDYEDEQVRGDKYDGTLKYSGDNGLDINNLTTGKSFRAPWTLKSMVDADKIFVFSTSQKLSKDLALEFNSDVCIEFSDAGYVISKLRAAVARRKSIKPNKLFHDTVTYYSEEDTPGINWAFPNKIAMRKLSHFSKQEEYRFAFSHCNALSFGETQQEIQMHEQVNAPRTTAYPEVALKIGKLRKRCIVHDFT